MAIIMFKAYAISIVWRCYKYLTLRHQCMRSILPLDLAELAANGNGRAYSNILPNYDETVAQYLKQAPPPSYQVAMSHFLKQQEQQQHHPKANNVTDANNAAMNAEGNNMPGAVALNIGEDGSNVSSPNSNGVVSMQVTHEESLAHESTVPDLAKQTPHYNGDYVEQYSHESKTPESDKSPEVVAPSASSSPTKVTTNNTKPSV